MDVGLLKTNDTSMQVVPCLYSLDHDTVDLKTGLFSESTGSVLITQQRKTPNACHNLNILGIERNALIQPLFPHNEKVPDLLRHGRRLSKGKYFT